MAEGIFAERLSTKGRLAERSHFCGAAAPVWKPATAKTTSGITLRPPRRRRFAPESWVRCGEPTLPFWNDGGRLGENRVAGEKRCLRAKGRDRPGVKRIVAVEKGHDEAGIRDFLHRRAAARARRRSRAEAFVAGPVSPW